MNPEEAMSVLTVVLGEHRELSYSELKQRIGSSLLRELVSPSGTEYQIEVQVFWDAKQEGNIRVQGAVSAGFWRQFVPLVDAFIIAPDGTMVE